MPSPLLDVVLRSLKRDLERESINNDLLNENAALLAAEVDDDDRNRVLFCCHVILSRLSTELMQEPHQPLEYFKDPPRNPLGVLIERGLAVLKSVAEHYGVEVAEFQMVDDERGAKQLAHDFTLGSQRKVQLAQLMLISARDGNAGTVGSAFYSFMYRDLQDMELLAKWVRALVEVDYGKQA